MDRAQLEALALEKISKMESVPSTSFDRASLEQMAIEKMASMGQAPIDRESEASLGVANRARYAIEPLQSNRKALLVREYGQDNVMEDKQGNLFLKQDNVFYPVNKEGFSVADAADFAGATPEIIGGVGGAALGALAGVPTGGAASVPLAAAVGATGAALGSGARQGLSALIGTPQVASVGERAIETGLSSAIGGATAGLGTYLKPAIQTAQKGISQFFKGAAKEGLKEIGESTTKTVANTAMDATGFLKPTFEKQTVENIMGQVADQSGREMVQTEAKKLAEIAAREGLPSPTYAQAAQGKSLIAEAKILDLPVISGKVRKTYDGQLKKIKENLEGITGKFIDVESDAPEVGTTMREMAETMIEATKKGASELYQQVEEEGANAMIGKRTFMKKFMNKAGELGLINPDLSRAPYAADSSFTRDTFKTLQDVVFDGLDALKNTKSDKIRFESANALRKTVKGYADELASSNPNASRLLRNFGKELDETVEGILNREAPKLGEKFREANRGWYKFKNDEELFNSITRGGNLDDEKIVKTVMGGTKNIEKMKELIGEDRVKEIGKTYVRDLLAPLGKSGIARADSALTAIRKQRAQITSAIGETAYNRLVDNLHFLNRTGQPLNVSRASLYNILDNRGAGLKDLTLKLAGTAKTLAESKGTTVTKAVKDSVVETTGRVVPTSSKGLSSAANLLTDEKQRALSFLPGSKESVLAERQKEIERRKRAISGSKK